MNQIDIWIRSALAGKHGQNASVCKFDPAKIGHVIESEIDKMSIKISKNNYNTYRLVSMLEVKSVGIPMIVILLF